ncbi:MAG TPA: hypothetical protein ENJ82_11935 [Bacteroidetes bacterium]|nr:hypothetical protein [Bacteroidota bacterium]
MKRNFRRLRLSHLGFAALLLALIGMQACAPSRYIRPLEKGEKAISVTLGGPLFTNFGYPMPIPLTTVTGAYGIKEDLTGFAALHPTSAGFGVIQMDLGISKAFLRPAGWKPGFTASPILGFAADVWEGHFKLWPQLDLNAWWEYGERKHFVYAGLSSWFELAGKRAHSEPQPQVILPGFQIGNTWSFGSVDYQLEIKASNISRNSGKATIEWVGIGGNGGVGIYLGVTKRF